MLAQNKEAGGGGEGVAKNLEDNTIKQGASLMNCDARFAERETKTEV